MEIKSFLQEKSLLQKNGCGRTCSLNGFEVTHFFSELSPGLNRVNTTAWVMAFTNKNVMTFFEIVFAWDNIWRFHMMVISFLCPSMERLEGLKRQLLWCIQMFLFCTVYSITWGSFHWFGLVLALYFLAFKTFLT